jgi:class 3 adenylate cyclase/tetratricopeptide (TPR) repeat protein
VVACPSCGAENSAEARFCSSCGSALVAPEAAREQRKVVTVLFCDLVGSTALGESTDPEALRARMRRYFEDLRTILERHGGSVEKFAGDAVMAVFGIPVAHEDDALRAVRAAAEMRNAVAGHGLESRIGVNTGEVVVGGEGETLVTGDPVNVAARLEQAASNGEILIGAETRLLVRDAVRVEPVEPLELKGKSQPVAAYRLLEVLVDAAPVARHFEIPLVGRERERQRLWRDYEDAVADRTCRLFTLLGPAGIGKSRLVADFLERIGESADVLRGRCLSYGEGITYWPLVEILISAGVEPESVIGSSPPETQLAFRRLLEARAAERPQAVVIDDLQWAEPTFVDLVEHVADLSRDVPIFLLCIARTELLDGRPDWGGGKLNATSLLLEPLGPAECSELMDTLVPDASLTGDLRERITTASAGNPLYVEEMLAMVREHGGDGQIVVPPTIHALLQARIDSLDGDVRVVMERGSVEGEVFHRGSVAVLAPDPVRSAVASHLATLVRKELIRSTSPTFPDDEGFRFRHLLIRDAAYESLPKATRAELHERFAGWLATHDLVELDEILGYHLEQAHRYRAELDSNDPALPGLAERAAAHLGAAGTGAMDRGDWGAARSLVRRARVLLPEGSDARAALAPEFSLALLETGESEEATSVALEAAAARDPIIRARGAIAVAEVHAMGAGPAVDEARARRDEVLPVFERAGDELGLALYWRSRGYDSWAVCRSADAREAFERALVHADAASAERIGYELHALILSSVVFGPTPLGEAWHRVELVLAAAREGSLREATARRSQGVLLSYQGRADEARELHAAAVETYRGAGLLVSASGWSMSAAAIELRAGDVDGAERCLRDAYEELTALTDRFFLPTVAARLADTILHRTSEAEPEVDALCAVVRERSIAGDLVNWIELDGIEARMLARRGRLDEALELGRRAVESADTTDFFELRGEERMALAEVLSTAGEQDELTSTARDVLAIYEAKGDVTGHALVRARLAALGADVA